MRHDYKEMSDSEVHELYADTFGEYFATHWDDDDPHRDEVIACIESGIPQDKSALVMRLPEGVVA